MIATTIQPRLLRGLDGGGGVMTGGGVNGGGEEKFSISALKLLLNVASDK
jgi:hypothetical protein